MTCTACQGSGFLYDPQLGHLVLCACISAQCKCGGTPLYLYWGEDGKRLDCPCRRARYWMRAIEQAVDQSEIPRRYRWKLRADFQTRTPDGTPVPQGDKIIASVARLVSAKEPPKRGLFLYGQPGTGKTLLGCIILNELMLHRGRPGRYLNLSADYFQRLRSTFSEESEEHGQSYSIMEELGRVPYLLIDDLGVQRNTEWEAEALYNLVEARYSQERFTVVTTNQPLEEIKGLSRGRIYSRLAEMCHQVEMGGPDWRLPSP